MDTNTKTWNSAIDAAIEKIDLRIKYYRDMWVRPKERIDALERAKDNINSLKK